MSKRKRDYDEDLAQILAEAKAPDRATNRDFEIRISQYKAHFDLTLKNLASALKLARGFERQKLGRRQKQSTDQPHALLKLREEVIVLKQLDLDMKAKNHLLKTLLKAKRIRESQVFVKLYGQQPKIEQVKQGPEADVQARLFQSNPAKEAMSGFMDRAYNILGIDKFSKESQKMKSANLQSNSGTRAHEAEGDPTETVFDHDNPDEGEANGSRSDQADDGLALEAYQDRLASSANGEDLRLVDSSEGPKASDSPTPPPVRRKEAPPTGASSFLPTLGATGYYSGSESASDIDDNDEGPPDAKPRKNRRGQTARRQIAQKKYGKEAQHFQSGNARSGSSRNSGWDAQRGAVDARQHLGGRFSRGRGGGRGGQRNAERVTTRANSKEQPIAKTATGTEHPSWQAAKLRKQQSNPSTAFVGKKISFD